MVTAIGLLTVLVTWCVRLRYPAAAVAVWIALAVVVASIVAGWSAQ